jgi:glycosyltransferase involved in cell wall biosynthesis
MKSAEEVAGVRRTVLFVLPTLRGGGAERVIVTLLRHLDRQRFEPLLAVVDMSSAAFLADLPADVRVIDLGSARVRGALPKIVRLIRSLEPDVVFSALSHLNLALAIVRPLMPDAVRYIARETNIVTRLIHAAYRRPRLWSLAYRLFYSRFDVIVCQTRAMRDDLVACHRVPESKTVVINNPVDVQRVRNLASSNPARTDAWPGYTPSPTRLIAIGRLSHEKGFDLLIEALALCGRRDLELLLVGEGGLRPELERLVAERGLGSQVRFLGFQSNPFPLVRIADALVISSRFEGLPNVVLEAFACGTPVIATPAPGVAEIVEGVVGCSLARDVSAPALARELARFEKGRRLAADCAQRYEVATIVRRYEEVLA